MLSFFAHSTCTSFLCNFTNLSKNINFLRYASCSGLQDFQKTRSSRKTKKYGEDELVIPEKLRKATYCVYNNINDNTRYIKCDICHEWYYVRCSGISEVRCFSI